MTVRRMAPGALPTWPISGPEEREGLLRALDQEGWWRNAGQEVDRFEREFADYHGAEHALALTTGTHALELALTVMGVGPGDEVIVPAFTFISCSLAVQSIGATPVPVDIRPDTYCIDVDAVRAAVTPRTKVVMPVHMAGQICDMDALEQLSAETGVAILQDAAHAHGARWKGKRVGELGTIAAFSFQNGKLMTAGEGGALLLPDEGTHADAYLRHGCGRPPGDRVYVHRTQGSNFRMNEFSAAVLRAQLGRLDAQIAVREARWAWLEKLLAAVPGVEVQSRDARCDVDPHYMALLRIPARTGARRLAVVDELNQRGVPAFVGFPPVYRTEGFWTGPVPASAEELAERCPTAEAVGADCVWLHHRVLLADEAQLTNLAEVVGDVLAED